MESFISTSIPGSPSYHLGRARKDAGWVWSRATLTIQNTKEGSSLIKEFVALSFVEIKARLIASRCNSSVNLKVKQVICLEAIYRALRVRAITDDVYVFFGVCKILERLSMTFTANGKDHL